MRVVRLNSLLKEVISEVLRRDIHHVEHIAANLVTITSVSITPDLAHAKVFVSILGPQQTKDIVLKALQTSSGIIGSFASKKVRMRQFPKLEFIIDDGLEKQMRVQELLSKISEEREARESTDSDV
jgi:ribosome-binding factor A